MCVRSSTVSDGWASGVGLMDGRRHEEGEVHGLLAKHRDHKEWFRDTEEVREFIKSHCYVPVFK